MRLHVVSDVHGRADALAAAGKGADALLCLGDLILFVDYADHSRGIMGELFGAQAVGRFVELRTARRFEEARAWSRSLWDSVGPDRLSVIEPAVRKQYAEMLAEIPTPTYLTYGNVDLPHLLDEHLRPGLEVVDGRAVDIGGLRVGFVGGGLETPMRTPHEISEEAYAAKVEAVGAVDVLCSHVPPHLPKLVYDTTAGRYERGSRALLDAIQRTQPRYSLFGHVHQPQQSQVRIGRTQCVNVGHFRSTGKPYVLEL